jgi:putative transport protein
LERKMSSLLAIFVITALGYLLGSLKIKGLSLGTSGILLVALVFGHYGIEIPAVVKNFGLAIFVGSVGMIAGPVFFRNFRKKVYAFLVMGIFIVVCGATVTMIAGKLMGIRFDLAIGIFTGALTSTPGLAAATESTSSLIALKGLDISSQASIGYGIAYPFGVVGVVLFVQLYPKLVGCNIEEATRRLHESLYSAGGAKAEDENIHEGKGYIHLEPFGLLSMALVMGIGILIGELKIPLPGGMSFSFGTAGGPLFAGLVFGHFGHVGKISLTAPSSTLKVMRELGLVLFLLGAGTEAGAGFVEVLAEQGVKLFLLGVLVTLVPMILACILAKLMFRLDALNTLGSVCGGMTSTPALGALISMCGSEDVAASYAATYPFALIFVVLGAQVMTLIW